MELVVGPNEYHGAGGGGGENVTATLVVTPTTTVTVTIGAGGAGGDLPSGNGADGGASSISGTGFTK